MSEWIWLIVDIIFLSYFVNLFANEVGLWSSRMFGPFLNALDFGKKRIFALIWHGFFSVLWLWVLLNDMKDVI